MLSGVGLAEHVRRVSAQKFPLWVPVVDIAASSRKERCELT